MNEYSTSPTDVLVVGAGFAGMYAVHAARKAGLSVVCLEAADGIGGTWYFNRYPGCRCDVESVDYSYSFDEDLQNEWQWTERYATQPEILAYLNHVAERFDLGRDIRLNTRVVSARFDEVRSRWQLETEGGAAYEATYVVFATGSLSAPVTPDIPGIDSFAGEIHYTARWPSEKVSFAGKRVAVIGTGSSGIQAVPEIADEVESLTVFQRTANFSVPAFNRPLSEEDQIRIRADYPERRRRSRMSGGGSLHEPHPRNAVECDADEREAALEATWQRGGVLFSKTFPDQFTSVEANDYAREFFERKIRAIVSDQRTVEDLIPRDHPIGTKRICTDSGYYETFNRDHVRLVNLRREPITRVTSSGIETSEESHPLDMIVFATGFDAMTGALTSIDLRGVDGATIHDEWSDGPLTYLGMQVPGLPNLFLVNGPGSPAVLANMVLTSEQQVDWIVELIAECERAGVHQVEARRDAAEKWTERVTALADATLMPRANSWYLGANIEGKKRTFMLFVGGLGAYTEICDNVRRENYEGLVMTTR